MATEPKSRRRRRKKILRKNDGSLYDVNLVVVSDTAES